MNKRLTIVAMQVVCLEIVYWIAFVFAIIPNMICILAQKMTQAITLKALIEENPTLKAMYDEIAKMKKEGIDMGQDKLDENLR